MKSTLKNEWLNKSFDCVKNDVKNFIWQSLGITHVQDDEEEEQGGAWSSATGAFGAPIRLIESIDIVSIRANGIELIQ